MTMGDDFFGGQELTFLIALSMIFFTLLFGVKHLDVSGYHSGIMVAIAFESLVKLIVLLLMALMALFWLSDGININFSSSDMLVANDALLRPPSLLRILVETVLAM